MRKRSITFIALRLLMWLIVLLGKERVHATCNYIRENGEITITGCTADEGGNLTIPARLENLPVTRISDKAFQGNWGLTNVTIPEGVTYIGSRAFFQCINLAKLTLPSSVTSIDEAAFFQCFGLTEIHIPKNVSSIGDGAFAECTHLRSISVDADNTFFSSLNGVLFDGNGSKLILYPMAKADTTYTTPETVTTIWPSAFASCTNLSTVILPKGLNIIGDYAFYNCTKLTSINIEHEVTSIGESAFYNCSSLIEVKIGNSVIEIGSNAFMYCIKIKIATLGENVSNIGQGAFYACGSLTNLSFGKRITEIGSWAFNYCQGLTTVKLPSSVYYIRDFAFASCPNLASIEVETGGLYYEDVDGVLFDKGQKELVQYPPAKTARSYIIPESVTAIGSGAFVACTNLTSVHIPSGVTFIGDSAFASCTGITSITIPQNVTFIDKSAFAGCHSLLKIYFAGDAPSSARGILIDTPATVYYLASTGGWLENFEGHPLVRWDARILTEDGRFGVQAGLATFTLSGAPYVSVVVESSADLAKPNWAPLTTNTFNDQGNAFFKGSAARINQFYRLRLR